MNRNEFIIRTSQLIEQYDLDEIIDLDEVRAGRWSEMELHPEELVSVLLASVVKESKKDEHIGFLKRYIEGERHAIPDLKEVDTEIYIASILDGNA